MYFDKLQINEWRYCINGGNVAISFEDGEKVRFERIDANIHDVEEITVTKNQLSSGTFLFELKIIFNDFEGNPQKANFSLYSKKKLRKIRSPLGWYKALQKRGLK